MGRVTSALGMVLSFGCIATSARADDFQSCVGAMGAPHGTVETCDRAIASGLKDVLLIQALDARGQEKLAVKNYAGAMADFDAALGVESRYRAMLTDPLDRSFSLRLRASALTNRGRAHVLQGNVEAAVKDYGEAIEVNSSPVVEYFFRAMLLARIGRNEEAIADLRKFIAAEDFGIYAEEKAKAANTLKSLGAVP